MQISSKVTDKSGLARGDKLIADVAAPAGRRRRSASASPATWWRATPSSSMAPLDPDTSRDALATWLALWREG